MSTVTVMRTVAHFRAGKTFIWSPTLNQWECGKFKLGKQFAAESRTINTHAEYATLVEEVRRDPRAFIVNGEMTAQAAAITKTGGRIRKLKLKQAHGAAPTLLDTELLILPVDIDDIPLLPHHDPALNPEECIRHAVEEALPDVFAETTYFWQLSSSAGFVPGFLSVHLSFELRKPRRNSELYDILRQFAPDMNPKLTICNQAMYTADPEVIGGYDPITRRTGRIKGLDDFLGLPDLTPIPTRKPGDPKPNGAYNNTRFGSVADALAHLGDHPAHGGRRFPWPPPGRLLALCQAEQPHERARRRRLQGHAPRPDQHHPARAWKGEVAL